MQNCACHKQWPMGIIAKTRLFDTMDFFMVVKAELFLRTPRKKIGKFYA